MRNCLVCGGVAKGALLGVDTCRACAAFYRRAALNPKTYTCRKGFEDCEKYGQEAISRCRKCRYSKCVRLGMQLKDEEPPELSSSSCGSSSSVSTSQWEYPRVIPAGSSSTNSGATQLLARIEEQLRMMNMVRKMTELSGRDLHEVVNLPIRPKLRQDYDDMTLVPSTFAKMNEWSRVCTSVAADFAAATFDDYHTLTEQEKWIVIKNFFNLYNAFDNAERTERIMAEPERFKFMSYTTYFDRDNVDYFFKDVDMTVREKADKVKDMVRGCVRETNELLVPMIKVANLTEMEKGALAGLIMWIPNMPDGNDRIASIADKYRNQIFRELHIYYKNELKRNEYADRLGNLTMLLVSLQDYGRLTQEKMEVFRLLDVVDDDTYVYRVTK